MCIRDRYSTIQEMAAHIDAERAKDAFQSYEPVEVIDRLMERHDMLRAYIDEDGMQHVLKELPDFDIPLTDLRNIGCLLYTSLAPYSSGRRFYSKAACTGYFRVAAESQFYECGRSH